MKKCITASPLFMRITSFCAKHELIRSTDTVVVGFSGGPDSLFLLHVLAETLSPEQIIAAHLDHGWRPESKSEAEWCKQTAESLGVRFIAGHLQDYTAQLKTRGSKEDSARQARRLFLKQIAEQCHAHNIALAHHADDQIETFFIRLIRGTGIQGLASMSPRQGLYIRPLLELTKHEIVSFLDANFLANNTANNNPVHAGPYLIDPSNMSPDYLRNRIRHTLTPALVACDTRAEKNIHAAITHIQEVDRYLDEQARKAYDALKNSFLNNNSLKIEKLQELDPLIRHRVLILWLCEARVPFTPSKAFFAEIERFLFQSQTSFSHQIAPVWSIKKERGSAFLKSL
jgi:tRNA(Ile)-lysidine synthetase-like protein